MWYDEFMTTIKQFEVAGQELGIFNVNDYKPRRFTWRLSCLRRPESDRAIAAIKEAIAKAEDPDRIPVKINWKSAWGIIEIDDTDEMSYLVDFEEMGQPTETSGA